MQDFNIFVNTTDTFEDCWLPFFTLFKKYWPDYQDKIYLNTETKDFAFDGLNIVCIKNGLINGKWSDCTLFGLNYLQEDTILYLQEDYFLNAPVNTIKILEFYNLFKENGLHCLHLTDQSTSGPFNKSTFKPELWEILPDAKYRISTQAAFWKKKSLIDLLQPKQSAWRFEKTYNQPLDTQPDMIFCVNHDIFRKNENEIIPYIFTGIIKGKWNKEVEKLFKSNNIIVNFSIRGFYKVRIPAFIGMIKRMFQ
jgi:hypothetical protein